MEELHIKHQFFYFMEKSKQIKTKIDSMLELLYEFVIDDSKELCPGLDFASMIELNEVFDLIDTYLSQFKDYVTSPPEKVTCNNLAKINTEYSDGVKREHNSGTDVQNNVRRIDDDVTKTNNVETNPVVHLDSNSDFSKRNNFVRNHVDVCNVVYNNEVSKKKNVESKHLHRADNHGEESNRRIVEIKLHKAVNNNFDVIIENNADKQLNFTHIEPHQLADFQNSEKVIATSACSSTGSNSYVCEQSSFTIKKEAHMKINGEYKVSIKHVENLNNFYVNIMNNITKEFLKNWNAMAKFYKNHSNDKEYILLSEDKNYDVFVAVLYNSLWYRAKILTREKENVFGLHLIDFGKLIKAKIQNCRLLKSEFGFPVVLQNVSLNLDFTCQRQALFNALVGDADEDVLFQVKCVDIVGGRYHIIMKDIGNVSFDINEIINTLPANESAQESNEQTTAEDIHAEASMEQALEDFNPMKSDFYSERNDFKINPDNACQAVMGYIPNDERRFCKFGKRCRKRACPRIHQELDPEGWTKDRENTLTEPYEIEGLPLNEIIHIDVSHVENLGEFYAQIEPNYDEEKETLDSLMDYLNEKDNIGNMKRLQTPPAPGQIVIASLKDVFYRGKVVESDSDTVLIYFVDFGSRANVHVKNLRQMEGKYNFLPYQALFFSIKPHLEFVIPTTSDLYVPCLHLFKSLILYKNLNCVVLSTITEPYSVKLFTKEMGDLVEYFNTCCKRILQVHADTDTTSESTFSGTVMKTFEKDEVAFIPG